MPEEVELAGGVKAVRADEAPPPTPEAEQAGQDPGLAPREPSPEETALGEVV